MNTYIIQEWAHQDYNMTARTDGEEEITVSAAIGKTEIGWAYYSGIEPGVGEQWFEETLQELAEEAIIDAQSNLSRLCAAATRS